MNTGVEAVTRWAQANPALAHGLMTLVTGFLAGKVALGALQYGFGSILTTFAALRNGFMMVRTAFMVIGPIIGAIGLWPVVIGAAVAAVAYLVYANWDRIKAAFAGGWQWVKNTLAAAPDWLKSIGAMMMEGLLMMLDPSRLATRLLDIAKTGIVAFKNFFGIKSPSRLMMEMGGHVATGLGHGIEDSAHQPGRPCAKWPTPWPAPALWPSPARASLPPAPPPLRGATTARAPAPARRAHHHPHPPAARRGRAGAGRARRAHP
jgi:hypothetical protein